MIPQLLFLFELGLVSLGSGLGLASWIWPTAFRGKGLDFTASLMMGFSLVTLSSTYLFLLGYTVYPAVPLSLALSLLLIMLRYFYASDLKTWLVQVFIPSRRHLLVILTGACYGGLLISPSLIPYPGQQYRIGIDQCGYGIAGQSLLDGTRLSSLRKDVLRETGQDNLDDALHNNSGILNITLKVASEFFLKDMRIGYPAMIGAIFHFLHQPLVYPYLFPLCFFPALFLVSILWFFFHHIVKSNYYLSLIYAVTMALNCNLLNNVCEGQHAQWLTSPYICLFFISLYLLREKPDAVATREYLILTAALSAFIVVIYSEAFLALAFVGGVMFLIDLCLWQKHCLAAEIKFGLAILLGLILTGPFFLVWFPVTVKQAYGAASGGAGYWQPYWAYPAEIVGWFDIYAHPGFDLLKKCSHLHRRAFFLSIPLVAVYIVYLAKVTRSNLAYWVSPICFVIGIYITTYFVHPIQNYAYMKAYTILFFPLCTLFFIALDRYLFGDKIRKPLLAYGMTSFLVLAIGSSFITGMSYLDRYYHTSQKLPSNITDLENLDRTIDFRKVAIITPYYFQLQGPSDLQGSIRDSSIGMLISYNWLNCQDMNLYLGCHQDMPIYIFALKSVIGSARKFTPGENQKIIFENSGFLLIDTGHKIIVPDDQLKTKYNVILAQNAAFKAGQSDSQQYQWKKLLEDAGF